MSGLGGVGSLDCCGIGRRGAELSALELRGAWAAKRPACGAAPQAFFVCPAPHDRPRFLGRGISPGGYAEETARDIGWIAPDNRLIGF